MSVTKQTCGVQVNHRQDRYISTANRHKHLLIKPQYCTIEQTSDLLLIKFHFTQYSALEETLAHSNKSLRRPITKSKVSNLQNTKPVPRTLLTYRMDLFSTLETRLQKNVSICDPQTFAVNICSGHNNIYYMKT